MAILVRNIYSMMCYAHRHLRLLDHCSVGSERESDPISFLGKVFCLELRLLLKQGLFLEYTEATEQISGLRGKLLLGESIATASLMNGKTWCSFTSLSRNSHINRIIKATLTIVYRLAGNHNVSREAKRLLNLFCDVDDVSSISDELSRLQRHSLNKHYRPLLHLSEIIAQGMTPQESGYEFDFRRLCDDEKLMPAIFEDFVRNYYRIEFPSRFKKVAREKIRWAVADGSAGVHLPEMQTDTSLTALNEHIVIETKYNSIVLTSHRFSPEVKKIRAGHISQVMAYMENLKRNGCAVSNGILLYASDGSPLSETHFIWGHRLDIQSLDLSVAWEDVCNQLNKFISDLNSVDKKYA